MDGGGAPGWALRNPYAVFALYIGLVVAGLAAALFVLPTRMMPYVQSPLISVVTMTPGYAPQEVETYFTKPIEERMTDLKGVRFIRSISQRDISIVTLQFPYGANMQRALLDVQQLAKQAEADLPYDRANLKPSFVVPVDPLNTPVLQVAVTGDGWDPVELRQFLANDVVNSIKRVNGVQQAYVFGGAQRQLRVDVDRTAAAAYGISLPQIRDALDRQNLSRSAGTLTGPDAETLLRGDQRVLSAGDLLGYPVMTSGDRTVFLRDLAKVTDGPAEVRSAYRFNGKPAVELAVVANPDASSPRVIAAVMSSLEHLRQTYPSLHFTPAYDNSRFVDALTKNMLEELLVSVVLAGLVLLIFLGDVSATVIVMTSIPTCLAIAVLAFVPMNLSINSSTLIGLLLAIGRLVDDSIVVIHAVHRRLEAGASPARAAVEGTREVFLPIAAATGVMILAIFPMVFSGGITQIMFVGLVWPIVFALLASLLVSLTLTPVLAAYLFKSAERPTAQNGWRERIDAGITKVLRPARAVLNRTESAYRTALAWALDNRAIVLISAALLTYAGIGLFPMIGSEMMPLADTGQASAYLEADSGTSFTAADKKAQTFEQILLRQPEVQRVSAEIGDQSGVNYFTGQAMNGVNSASYLITFKPKEERRRSIWQIMDAVQAQAMAAIPGVRRLSLKEMGADVMASNTAPLEILAYGPDEQTIHAIADRVESGAARIPGVVQPTTSSALTQPEYRIDVDRARAAQIGLTPDDVQQQAYYATHGGLTTEYYTPSNIRHSTILVRYSGDERANVGDLARVQIVGANAAVVPLSALATITRAAGPTLIERDALRRSVSVLGYYRRGGPGEMALDMQIMQRAMETVTFPQGYGLALRGDMTEMPASFARLISAMEIALVFILLLLVSQFRSVVQPLVMLLAIPLELFGIFTGLLLAHQSFSTVSILGIVVANGMAVSNAILLLDLIVRNRAAGATHRDAILAAGPVRLQPILMTTIVSLAVLIPVAFFPKTGIDAYSPLATVIIGGLSVSTFLTLLVVPVLYDLIEDGIAAWQAKHTARSAAAEAADA